MKNKCLMSRNNKSVQITLRRKGQISNQTQLLYPDKGKNWYYIHVYTTITGYLAVA